MTKRAPTIQPTREDCIYAAGFIDGEGCIAVQRPSQRRGPASFRAYVEVAQVDPAPLEFLAARWGGGIYTFDRSHERYGGNARPIHSWRIASRVAVKFLRDIAPFAIVKRTQIANVLGLYELERKPRMSPTLGEQAQFYLRSLELNRKGT